MLNQLKLQRDIMVLESFNLSSIKDIAYKMIPNVISEFNGFINMFSLNQPAIQVTSKQKDFLREITKHSYLDLSPLHVYVPEGLESSYKAYCVALEGALQQVENLPTELSNYQTFLSRLLNNADDLKSTDYAGFKYETMNNELDSTIQATGKCFKKNSTTTEVKYSTVVQNNSEWTKVFEQINMLTKRIDGIKRTDLLKQIESIKQLLDMIQNKIKRQEIDTISSEMVAKIGDYTYIMARYMEFYSVTYYRIQTLSESINQTVEKVYGICTRQD